MMIQTNIKTYSELIRLETFIERFTYLQLNGAVGADTFGFDRYINQKFYKSLEWKRVRNEVILRDNGCDLGMEDYTIYGKVLIHHMNPIIPKDIHSNIEMLLNPEYLISTTLDTHNAIHYGDVNLLAKEPVTRSKNDTCPWRH